eukprot:gene7516-9237_t
MVHELSNTYYFYYMPKRPKNMSDYLSGLQCIDNPIRTVEDFWSYYSHMIRPVDEFSSLSDIYLFKEGIRPVWEDEDNVKGAFIGDQIDGSENINGIVISFRSNDNNLIGIWNKDAENTDTLLNSLKNLFKIEKLDYKPHFTRMLKEESLHKGGGGNSNESESDSLRSSLNDSFDFVKFQPQQQQQQQQQLQSPQPQQRHLQQQQYHHQQQQQQQQPNINQFFSSNLPEWASATTTTQQGRS